MIMPSDRDMRAAMAEGLRVMVSKLPAYQPDLPTHRGYDIVLIVHAHDQEKAQVMSNLMPAAVSELLRREVACDQPSPGGQPTSSNDRTPSRPEPATNTSLKKSRTRSTTPSGRARSKRS